MIISNKNGNVIYKSWRENGVKKSEEVSFRPYFYVQLMNLTYHTILLANMLEVSLSMRKEISSFRWNKTKACICAEVF